MSQTGIIITTIIAAIVLDFVFVTLGGGKSIIIKVHQR